MKTVYKIRRKSDGMFFLYNGNITFVDDGETIYFEHNAAEENRNWIVTKSRSEIKEGDLEIVEFSLVEVGTTKTEKGTFKMRQKS